MAGDQGFKSAIVAGLVQVTEADRAPAVTATAELSRLHAAVAVLEKVCAVASPVQGLLRWLWRELCPCIFEDWRPESDVFSLVPHFSIVSG